MAQKPANEFDKPLNEWIEEEVEVPTYKPQVNEKENRVEFVKSTMKVKQKTFYTEGKTAMIVCNAHVYYPLDKGKYLFRCSKCMWNRIAPPITFRFDQETGILTYRHSGIRV